MKPSYLFTKILITGGIVLGLELAASRILTPFFGVSIYVWSGILSVTLIALALGYKAGGVLAARLSRAHIGLLYASSGALAALWLDICAWTYPYVFWPLSDFDLVLGSILACLYLLFVPLVILSALNPLLVALLERKDGQGDHGAGSVFFVSTIGSVLGVFAVAFGMLPYLTNYQTVVVLAASSALLSILLLAQLRTTGVDATKALVLGIVAFLIAALTLATGGLERFAHDIKQGKIEWRMVYSVPSYFGNIQIVDLVNANGIVASRLLLNDGLLQNQFYSTGPSGTLYTYALEKLGLAAVKEPHKALVLGIGAGVIPTGYCRAGLEVTAVDINPRIVAAAKKHLGFDPSIMTIDISDARTAARHGESDYDIVAVDLFRGDGIPEHLVTREFFSDIRNRLKEGGVLVMNTFMDIKDPRAGAALVKTVASVFGETALYPKNAPPGHSFTVAFLVARKGGPVGPLVVSLENMPIPLRPEMEQVIKSVETYSADDPRLMDAPILTDVSNQWKHLAFASELSYRQEVVSKLPWQILMN